MHTQKQIKQSVLEKYQQIAEEESCCGCGCSSSEMDVSENYSGKEGYIQEANLGLGCGIPTDFAEISPGNTVLDLGSGAGNDAFIARSMAGEKGRVIGIDMTPGMIEKAKKNAEKLHYENVHFIHGDIENIPLPDSSVDVVISNCVLNLVPDKEKAFSEIFRVLKPGGHLCVSDIVLEGYMPEILKKAAELYVGCISGALDKPLYMNMVEKSGFDQIIEYRYRKIEINSELISQYLNKEQLSAYYKNEPGIYSITFSAQKSA